MSQLLSICSCAVVGEFAPLLYSLDLSNSSCIFTKMVAEILGKNAPKLRVSFSHKQTTRVMRIQEVVLLTKSHCWCCV